VKGRVTESCNLVRTGGRKKRASFLGGPLWGKGRNNNRGRYRAEVPLPSTYGKGNPLSFAKGGRGKKRKKNLGNGKLNRLGGEVILLRAKRLENGSTLRRGPNGPDKTPGQKGKEKTA